MATSTNVTLVFDGFMN